MLKRSLRLLECGALALLTLTTLSAQEPQDIPAAAETPADQAARAVAGQFLAAASADAALPFIDDAEKHREAVQAFYASDAFKRAELPEVTLVQSERQQQGGDIIFRVNSRSWPDPVALVFSHAEGQPKLNWPIFREFYSQALLNFLEKNDPPTGSFRVLIKRGHYFEKDVPGIEDKECFMIMTFSKAWNGNVFLAKDSTLAAKLKRQIPWGTVMSAIVDLKNHTDGEHPWVEMTDVTSFFWTATSK